MDALRDLGWSAFFERQWSDQDRAAHTPARVVEEHKGVHRLMTERGEVGGEVPGRMRHLAGGPDDLPAVGDWLAVRSRWPERRATIIRILERRTKLSRLAAGAETKEQVLAANLDTVFLVCGLDGDFNPRRIERYLVLLWESGARPVLLLNKADLCSTPEMKVAQARAAAPAVELHVVSALRGSGLEALRTYLGPGQTVALVGSSGAGKSTLVNRLAGADLQRIAATRESDDRGRHATTSRTLIVLPDGGLLIDTPGLRELALWDGSAGLEQAFEEIERLAQECRFRDCRHRGEPLCAVRRALEDGSLDPERFASYAKLERERAHAARRRDLRARLDEKRRIKKIHKVFRDPRWPG